MTRGLPNPRSLRRSGKRLPPVEPYVQELLWAIVREKGGTIASHIEKAIVLYAKQLETEEKLMETEADIDDGLDTCTYCGGKYDPGAEGHTELDDNEEETGNYFCSPECESNHYREIGKPIEPASCRWTLEPESESWEAGCGGTFILNEGTPSQNNMSYCCFCGKPLQEIILSESGDDDND
jgi:ribosomal protein L24E